MALTAAISAPPNEAQAAALRHFSDNLRALARSQPVLIAAIRRPEIEYAWAYGRDGSLTAQTPAGEWLADCSLPYRAACEMLKSVETRGPVACLLAPVHVAQVRRAMELLSHQQALIVVAPDEAFLPVALHCHNLSEYFESHRLFFAVGPAWAAQLGELFQQYPGLPIPNLFLRPPTTSEVVSHPLIETAQRLFTETIAARNVTLAGLASSPVTPKGSSPRRVCVVAPSVYKLWSDAAAVLAESLSRQTSVEVRRLDPERPTTSSHLALAAVARECDAIFTTDFGRGEVPAHIVPDAVPWVTYATTANMPDGRRSLPHDRLVVADPAFFSAAIGAGWQKPQLSAATWPRLDVPPPAAQPVGLALIADTEPLRGDVDEETFEFSSHMVLWELIASELHSNPLLAADDPDAYLTSRMARLSIGPDGFDRGLFLNTLIMPAYQQGLARALVAARLPLRLFGRGWGDLPEFAAHAAGPVGSHAELLCATSSAVAIIRATPGRTPHPVNVLGRPVVVPCTGPIDTLIRSAKGALAGKSGISQPAAPPLSGELVVALLANG